MQYGKVPLCFFTAYFVMIVCVCKFSCSLFRKSCLLFFTTSFVPCIVLAFAGVDTTLLLYSVLNVKVIGCETKLGSAAGVAMNSDR